MVVKQRTNSGVIFILITILGSVFEELATWVVSSTICVNCWFLAIIYAYRVFTGVAVKEAG